MTQEPHKESLATRRGMLASVGLVGLAGAVTACGASSSSSSASAANAGNSSAPATPSSAASSSAASSSAASSSAPSSSAAASGGTSAGALAATSDIPVGGGMIFTAKLVVVTQPSKGDFKAFSAVCTHMGCTVSTIKNGTIDCPCHGSAYSIKNGAVVAGPAPSPLPAKKIKVSGSSIFLE